MGTFGGCVSLRTLVQVRGILNGAGTVTLAPLLHPPNKTRNDFLCNLAIILHTFLTQLIDFQFQCMGQ